MSLVNPSVEVDIEEGFSMPAEENGIVRWRDFVAAVDKLRNELKEDLQELREVHKEDEQLRKAAWDRNAARIAELAGQVATLNTWVRVTSVILTGLLLALLGLVINILSSPPP